MRASLGDRASLATKFSRSSSRSLVDFQFCDWTDGSGGSSRRPGCVEYRAKWSHRACAQPPGRDKAVAPRRLAPTYVRTPASLRLAFRIN